MTTGSLDTASRDSGNSLKQLPVVIELPTSVCAASTFRRLRYKPHCVFLDSSLRHKTLGRYSYVTCDPFELIREPCATNENEKAPAGNAAADLVRRLNLHSWQSTERKDLPPFQGGLAGVLTYEVGHAFEQLPQSAIDEFQIGSGCLAAYDVVVAFDHDTNRAWIVSQGFPETDINRRLEKATERAQQFQTWILDKMAELVEAATDLFACRASRTARAGYPTSAIRNRTRRCSVISRDPNTLPPSATSLSTSALAISFRPTSPSGW